jgi:hypothetical protein
MNITREIISDLWPVYASGDASADTRALIDEFLERDPEFARILRARDDESLLGHHVPKLPMDSEAKALRKTKRLLHGWDWLLFLAMLFSGFAFGRIVSDTSWDVSPRNFMITAAIALAFWIAFFTRLVMVRKRVYGSRRGGAGR